MAGRFEPLLDGKRGQRSSETEFVTVGVNWVEEALTPFGIAGRWRLTLVGCGRHDEGTSATAFSG